MADKHDACVCALRALSRHLALVMQRLWRDLDEPSAASAPSVMGGSSAGGGAHALTSKVLDALKVRVNGCGGAGAGVG